MYIYIRVFTSWVCLSKWGCVIGPKWQTHVSCISPSVASSSARGSVL